MSQKPRAESNSSRAASRRPRVGAAHLRPSPAALADLRERDFQIATIPNLHARVNVVDSDWCLVGSGNLTGTGLGGAEGGNIELGVLLNATQIRSAAALVDGWWVEKAEPVSDEEIAAYAALPKVAWSESAPSVAGAVRLSFASRHRQLMIHGG